MQTECSLIYTHENQTNQLIWTKHFELAWVYSKSLFITFPALFVDSISILTSEDRSIHCPKASWKLTHECNEINTLVSALTYGDYI